MTNGIPLNSYVRSASIGATITGGGWWEIGHRVWLANFISIVNSRVVLTMLDAGTIVCLILQRFLRTYACRSRTH
ncbi:hypothetical protein F5887DRAFT_984791 [Amanita rubescens]|nr:hypothetical protein F5887DRAFT_1010523 [Amanita rubescens]KAF8337307.1 hypothetical protein F5887DRAFT_984791 [Amanita rubescens]